MNSPEKSNLMQREEALTDALAQLQELGVAEADLAQVGMLAIGKSIAGQTENGKWRLVRNNETGYQVITEPLEKAA